LLVRNYKGKDADVPVARIDLGVVSLVAELGGHERSGFRQANEQAAEIVLHDVARYGGEQAALVQRDGRS
jgi:hypothetical protein